MSTVAAVLLAGPPTRAAPAATTPWALAEAMAEDVLGVLGELDGIADAVLHTGEWAGIAARIAWPTTELIALPGTGDVIAEALAALALRGFTRAVLVTPDAPDLPALHLAKVLRALDSAAVAVVPAHDGGLVALAARLDPGNAAPTLPVDLDGAAPPGARPTLAWRRVRGTGDLARLDPGLEGWETSRALLGR